MSEDLSKPAAAAPGLARRLASLTYEGVVLFGVVFVAGYLYSALTQQRNAMQGRYGLMAFEFLVLGIYFIWFWTHGGQTVAMRAWHLRVVDEASRPLSQVRALARYAAALLWFAPALLVIELNGIKGTGPVLGTLLLGMLIYALLSLLLPRRQFLHDVVCKTQLITQLPVKKNVNKP
ncbi:RDD family protein [Roseateles toxinivorans]|uniref:Putative RDD family membrane protein YckC n=1 Tax=Roseateles toxinivorans TaxID=270368 RepID=A0A4R6QMG7_9BURK|nr:RDD family protein [Roseateles toxinivorans]TDP64035.1 putative RDD family membrane protein YckC [Roseateles toxinivorans]